MKCWVRACKHNGGGECTRYANEEELLQGGCALTWFLTGKSYKGE